MDVPCRVCSARISFLSHPIGGGEVEIELTGLDNASCLSCGHNYSLNGVELDELVADATEMIRVA